MHLGGNSKQVFHILVPGWIKFTGCGWILCRRMSPLKMKGPV